MATLVAIPTSRGELFNGDFNPAGGPFTATVGGQFTNAPTYQSPSRVAILTDTPPPGIKQYARFTVQDTDLTGDPSPRCQIVSPYVARLGGTYRFRFWTRFNYSPVFSGSNFYLFCEIYGPPFYQSPQIQFVLDGAGNIALENFSLGAPYHIWKSPLPVGVWMHFTLTAKMHTDPTQGWVQLGYASDGTDNDVAQTLTWQSVNYSQFAMQTLNVGTGNAKGIQAGIFPDLYRSRGLETTSVVDHAGYRVDTIA